MQLTNLKKYQRMSVNINCLVQIWLDFMTMIRDFHWNLDTMKQMTVIVSTSAERQYQLFRCPRDLKGHFSVYQVFGHKFAMPPLHSKDFSTSLNHLKDILTQPRYTSWFIIPLLFIELILNVIIINYVKCKFCC